LLRFRVHPGMRFLRDLFYGLCLFRRQGFESMAAFVNTNRTFTALDQPITPLTQEVTPTFSMSRAFRLFAGAHFSTKDCPAKMTWS
jgi:hypothetical protein